jgi:hypothetical protein
MARDQRFNSHQAADSISVAKPKPGVHVKQIVVPLVLLIGALVFGIACSKRGGSPSASSQSASAQNSSTSPVLAAPVATTLTSQEPVAKRVPKRRPVNATYADATYKFSFRYPRKYKFGSGRSDKAQTAGAAIPMNFVQPGGSVVADVQLPKNTYPGTDFASGMFQASVNPGLTAAQCEQFANPDTDELTGESLVPSEVKIGGRKFQEMDHFSGPGQPADAKYYHAFEKGMCYEFALALDRHELVDGMKPVEPAKVFGKLDKILATVRLESMVEQPQVTAGESAPAQAPQQETNNNQ